MLFVTYPCLARKCFYKFISLHYSTCQNCCLVEGQCEHRAMRNYPILYTVIYF